MSPRREMTESWAIAPGENGGWVVGPNPTNPPSLPIGNMGLGLDTRETVEWVGGRLNMYEAMVRNSKTRDERLAGLLAELRHEHSGVPLEMIERSLRKWFP